MICCGIFCNPQKGSENKGKICRDLPTPGTVSCPCHVPFFAVSKSGYYSFVKRMSRPEKDAVLSGIVRQQQDKCFHTYGYRWMWQWLKGSKGIYHDSKTILRVMNKYVLLAEIRHCRKWQQMGPAAAQTPESSPSKFSHRSTKPQMSNCYFLTALRLLCQDVGTLLTTRCQIFFILKAECIYCHKPATFSEANDMIDRHIHFYNFERIQSKTGVAPLTLRHSR